MNNSPNSWTWTWNRQYDDYYTQYWNGARFVTVWGKYVTSNRQHPSFQLLYQSLYPVLCQRQQQQQPQPSNEHHQEARHESEVNDEDEEEDENDEDGEHDEDKGGNEHESEQQQQQTNHRDSVIFHSNCPVRTPSLSAQSRTETESVISADFPAHTIRGNPQQGRWSALDSSYQIQPNARQFFKQGRMFAILFSEPMGETAPPNLARDNVTVVIYGGHVYTDIRRFVVVKEKRGFCYACPVSTYKRRGTTKPGVDANAHAIVYCTNSRPYYLLGENRMTKEPIAIEPANSSVTLEPESRINFGLHHPIQHNVKVKDLGRVCAQDMGRLIAYWHLENDFEEAGSLLETLNLG
ncbi:uncharacterized protein K452DRAFT_320603 [Aplosporella prunicola CBS 121167]|uniref:DUF6590 domain-containing protein n=1 Tax=Aplosporella prunicola CBS 121167 TaxID=1176127 RepID=A0A6A6B7J6_9PEZI|nr:uncharacterized protein K452DRAFT_320603 [Aplosporella prunicola CBS 121167]KAF2138947.1 hypothetical protein K452DRAFT_320603 [Aplosporella prunicola CBS 121167]